MKTNPKNLESSMSLEVKKCMALAQKAIASGDRILAENFYQQAEHYVRLNNKVKKNDVVYTRKQKPIIKKSCYIPNDFEMSIEQELEQELSIPQ